MSLVSRNNNNFIFLKSQRSVSFTFKLKYFNTPALSVYHNSTGLGRAFLIAIMDVFDEFNILFSRAMEKIYPGYSHPFVY